MKMMMISNRLAGRTKSFLGRKAVSDRYLGDDGFRWRDVMARPCCKGGVRLWRRTTRTMSRNITVHASSSSSISSSSSGKESGWTYLQIDDERNENTTMLRETMVTFAKENIPLAMILWILAELPAIAVPEGPMGASPPASSYYVSLGLFLLTLPGLWSLIKRAPKAKIKRKTFEVSGPAKEDAMPLDARARQIFDYFKSYNYTVKSTGDVITFEGKYQASFGQAAALVLYTLVSLASTALVLSIAAPFGGNYWYLMCLISPAAGAYYLRNANRTEEFKVKMVTADDDSVTDILVEGDEEEIDRMRKELSLSEKGMEYVKGILER